MTSLQNRQMQTTGHAPHSQASVHLCSLRQIWSNLKTHTSSATDNRISCLTTVSQTATVSGCQSDISNQCRMKKACSTGGMAKNSFPPRAAWKRRLGRGGLAFRDRQGLNTRLTNPQSQTKPDMMRNSFGQELVNGSVFALVTDRSAFGSIVF